MRAGSWLRRAAFALRISDVELAKAGRRAENDYCPMWVGDRIYFLSDRTAPVTLYSYDTKTKKVAQAVQNTGMDFKSASAGPRPCGWSPWRPW